MKNIDGFYMPAEYARHEGTIMIYPTRPGSWGRDRSGALKSFGRIFAEILVREKLFLIVDEEHIDEAAECLYRNINKYCDDLKMNGRYMDVFKCILKEMHKEDDDEIILEDLLDERCVIISAQSDDAWARDVAPTFVVKHKSSDKELSVCGINWSFNAWGGEVDGLYANWDKDDAIAKEFCKAAGYECFDAAPFVLEGGSIHSDGEGTLMVTESCLLSAGRNPDMTKEQIEEVLKKYLGVTKVLWLPYGIYNDETNEHVDNVCAFVGPAEVVLAWTDNEEDPQYAMSKADFDYLSKETDAKGRKLTIHKLPIPDHPELVNEKDLANYEFEEGEDFREVGERLAASYVNFYFCNGAALVPQFGGDNEDSDKRAIDVLKKCCKDREVIGIPARDILLGGGNIHCITQQVPANK